MGKVFWVLSLTSIHPGVGRAEAAHVDLPVQRDEFGLPAVWASSLKGALRSKAERRFFDERGVCVANPSECASFLAAFGPRPESASEHASGLVFLDARLVAIPARSLKGVWLWATSPMLLNFVKLYSQALGHEVKLPEFPKPAEGRVVLSDLSYAVDGRAFINELEFEVDKSKGPELDLPPLKKAREIVGNRPVAYLNDDDFMKVVRRSLLVQYRVRLSEKKTVQTGPWSEEYVPPFTIFVSGVHCNKPPSKVKVRVKDGQNPAEVEVAAKDLCEYAKQLIGGVVWLGGKETVGKGLVEVVW
ncbi:MAG: type III-B CRISPR module RAMP protein Cmr4 [Pyrobaculum sp.]